MRVANGHSALIYFGTLVPAITHWLDGLGGWAPGFCLAIFLLASMLMIWRLESMSASGMEGTVLGTLVMPYCSGLGNLIFAYVLGSSGGDSREIMTNSLVNNVTNLTLLIGLPAALFGLSLVPEKRKKPSRKKSGVDPVRLNRLSLLLSLTAAVFFTGVMWALARDGKIDFGDGLVLVGMFLFWQAFHVFEVLKASAQQNRWFGFRFFIDFALLLVGAFAVYVTIDWLVAWVSMMESGFISARHLGWLSGWLMVVPNALLAFYYAWQQRAEVVYSSQIGDGHICIPLCVGVFALFRPIAVPAFFNLGVALVLGAAAVHFLLVAVPGRLPRLLGWALVVAYGVFLYRGFSE